MSQVCFCGTQLYETNNAWTEIFERSGLTTKVIYDAHPLHTDTWQLLNHTPRRLLHFFASNCVMDKTDAKRQYARAHNKRKHLRSYGKVLATQTRGCRDKATQFIIIRRLSIPHLFGFCSTLSLSGFLQIFAVVRANYTSHCNLHPKAISCDLEYNTVTQYFVMDRCSARPKPSVLAAIQSTA